MNKKDSINSSKFSVVNLSGYTKPEVKEVYNKDWVKYGDNNDYFNYLIENYLGSPTNSRCINGIVDMIFGRGLEALDRNEKPKEYLKMKQIVNERHLKRIVHDFKALGQGAFKVKWDKSKKCVIKITHFPIETLRAEKAEAKGNIKAYYYHPKWTSIKNSDEPKRIPTFGNGSKSQLEELYVIKPYRSGFYYYSPVDYNGCLQYCELEQEVQNYHVNNIKNGLQPSLLINFNNGVPPEETQELLERKIYDKFSGTSNAGKFIIAFNESPESKADLEPIHLNLYFVTLQPIEFTELENISTKIKREEETGEKLSSQKQEEVNDFSDEQGDDLLSQLEGLGETISAEWDLVHSEELKDAESSFNFNEFADANPELSSKEDNGVYKVRYAYMPVRNNPNSRSFCKKMESLTSNNLVFRKEDINQMSFKGVNKELGHNKQNYSLLKFKGGKNCHHYWEIRVYKKIGGKQVTPKDDYIEPNNPQEASEKMIDRPDNGAYPKI